MNLKIDRPISFFDIEATGLDIIYDRIVEIAIVKIFPDGRREKLHKKINPERKIPLDSSKIHGIYDKDVLGCPTFFEVSDEIFLFLEGTDFAGFNLLKFDIPILVESFLRIEVDINLEDRKIIDVQRIFHLMEKRNLSAAYKFYCNKNLENAHTAMADTEATIDVLEAQIALYENKEMISLQGKSLGNFTSDISSLASINTSGNVDFAGRISKDAYGDFIFNFGTHKGKKIKDVLCETPGYYDWMIKGNFALDTKHKLIKIKKSFL